MRTPIDFQLISSTAIIIAMGMLIQNSIAPELFTSHTVFLLVGFLASAIVIAIDASIFKHLGWHLYVATLLILGLTLVFATETRGAARWIAIGPVTIQTSELAKIGLILSLAKIIDNFKLEKLSHLGVLALITSLPLGLIFLQPDLGSAIILGLIAFSIIFAAGIRLKHLALIPLFSALTAPFAWNFLQSYQKDRIISFLNPTGDPLGKGYNSIQALIAVGSGQLTGRGLGHGTQSNLRFLPEYHSDFVFSSLAEELGLLGSLLLLAAYAWLILRLVYLANKSETRFSYIAITGIASMFATQVVINIGMNIGLLPVTGITLPFISSGGTSIITSLVALGLALNLSKSKQLSSTVEITGT